MVQARQQSTDAQAACGTCLFPQPRHRLLSRACMFPTRHSVCVQQYTIGGIETSVAMCVTVGTSAATRCSRTHSRQNEAPPPRTHAHAQRRRRTHKLPFVFSVSQTLELLTSVRVPVPVVVPVPVRVRVPVFVPVPVLVPACG